MGKEAKPRQDVAMVTLRNDATALVADNADTAVTDARLKDYKQGFGIAAVSAMDVASTDELYTLVFEGRQEGSSGAYTELGRITMGAAGAGAVAPFTLPGVFSVNLPNLKGDMRSNLTVTGSTPSINLNYVGVVATRIRYGLDVDASIAP